MLKNPVLRNMGIKTFIAALSIFSLLAASAVQAKTTSAYNSTKTEILPLAKQYLDEGKLPEAQNLLDTMLSLEPYNGFAHLLMAKTFLNKKKYENACRELSQAEQFAPNEDVASQANSYLDKIPAKFKQPEPRGCLTKQLDAGEDSTVEPLRQNPTLLVFGATWQNQFKSVADNASKLAVGANSNVTVKKITLGEPGCHQMFDLFTVSQLPAVVALDKNVDFKGAVAGKISNEKLAELIEAANK